MGEQFYLPTMLFSLTMKKDELLFAVLTAVSAETEISKEEIMSKSRKEEVVDARHIAVKLLHDLSLYPSQIAEMFGITSRAVNLIINNFRERTQLRKYVGINYELAKKKIGMKHFTCAAYSE